MLSVPWFFPHNNCVFSVLFHKFVQVWVEDVDRAATIQTQAARHSSRYSPAGRTAPFKIYPRRTHSTGRSSVTLRSLLIRRLFFPVPGENSPLRGSNTHQLTAYSRLLPNGLSLSSYDPACCCTACGYVSAASCSVRPTATFLQPVAIFLTCSWLPFYRVFISLCHFSFLHFLITFPSVISPPAPCHFLSTFHRRQIHAEPAIQLLNYRLCIFSLYFFILKF